MTGTSSKPVILLTEEDLSRRYVRSDGEPMFNRRQIATWRERGEGPTAVKLSGRWRYTLASVHAWEATLGIRPEHSSTPVEDAADDS